MSGGGGALADALEEGLVCASIASESTISASSCVHVVAILAIADSVLEGHKA